MRSLNEHVCLIPCSQHSWTLTVFRNSRVLSDMLCWFFFRSVSIVVRCAYKGWKITHNTSVCKSRPWIPKASYSLKTITKHFLKQYTQTTRIEKFFDFFLLSVITCHTAHKNGLKLNRFALRTYIYINFQVSSFSILSVFFLLSFNSFASLSSRCQNVEK